MSRTTRWIPGLLFGSGFCALVYQVAWMREFRLIFGVSTMASAAVLAIFVAGLGAGSLLLGPRADRHQQPLALYSRLELLIAATTAATPILLAAVRYLYVGAGGTVALGPVAGTGLRLALSVLVLGAPTFLMGGTLPAAARAAASDGDARRQTTALLYGVNTLGAVSGAFVTGFFLLEIFGTRRTLWLACLVNVLVAVTAQRMARALSATETAPAVSEAQHRPAQAPPRFVLAAAGIAGFVFFLMELVWYRMLGPILGGTVFTFALILSVALLGIGIGGALYAFAHAERPASLAGFAATCLLEAVALAVPYALGDRIAVLAIVLRPLGNVALFWGHVLGWTVLCSLVVLPAAIVAGFQFPLLIALLGQGRARLGRHVGLAYAWNTGGAILGSLAGGFGLLPLLGAPGVWRLMVLALVATGIAALAVWARRAQALRGSVVTVLASLAALVVGLLASQGPTSFWRHSGIGAGRGPDLLADPNMLRSTVRYYGRNVLWETDGVESTVALGSVGPSLAFIINGKNDGSARGDADTMIMSGLVGALIHPDPRRSLVIGLGTGSTAGWLAAVPTMERTDVVELEPQVLRVARDCAAVNRGVLSNQRVHVTLGDAREVLLVSREKYDVVFSEPSNPYRAGVASLFTREYYEGVAKRLAPGGIFLQWIQSYEVDTATMASVYATLHTVFPAVETWQVSPGDLLLLASREPVVIDVPRLRARLAAEPLHSVVRAVWQVTDVEGFLGWHLGNSTFGAEMAERGRRRINTDDLNHVEFGFARTVGRSGMSVLADLRLDARVRGEDRPSVQGGDVDWERVEEARMRHLAEAIDRGMMASLGAKLGLRRWALLAATKADEARDSAAYLAAWKHVGREPQDPYEVRLLATHLAETGDEGAMQHVQSIRASDATTAAILEGRLRLRQGRADAVDLLCTALERLRTDPWPEVADAAVAISLAREAGQRFPQHARRLIAALAQPLAVREHDELRRDAMVQLATLADDLSVCSAVEATEPNVPWDPTWLRFRERCYAVAHDARWARSRADLGEYLRGAPDLVRRRSLELVPTPGR